MHYYMKNFGIIAGMWKCSIVLAIIIIMPLGISLRFLVSSYLADLSRKGMD